MAGITFGRFAAAVPVSDIGRALAFYQDILGMTVTFTNGDPTGFVILRRDAAELHLTLVRGHRAGLHNVAHLMVTDATALHDHLVASGVRIVKGLRDADYGLRGFVMADPDGNRIDVGQRLLRQCGAHRDRALGAVGRRPAGLHREPGRDLLRRDHRMALLVQGEHLRAEVPALRVTLASVRIHRYLHRPSLPGRTVSLEVARRDGTRFTFAVDEHPRRSSTLDKLASLKPLHPGIEGFSITAGNSAGVNDGAAAMVVTDRAFAEEHGLEPLAVVRA